MLHNQKRPCFFCCWLQRPCAALSTVLPQALMLMYQLLAGRNAVSERFYRALYTVLLTEGATGAAGEGLVRHMGSMRHT